MLSDCLAAKGLLYVKILTPCDSHLHIVTTHTQASYTDASLELWCETYFTRYLQLQEVKNFLKTIPRRPGDTVLVCGDLNQNATDVKNEVVYRNV